MFAPIDQKASFRKGSNVRYDYVPGMFKIVGKTWECNGALSYNIQQNETVLYGVREKDLSKQ